MSGAKEKWERTILLPKTWYYAEIIE